MSFAGHDQRRRTARRRLILTGAAVAAVAVGAVAAVVVATGSGHGGPAKPTAAPVTTGGSAPPATGASGPLAGGVLPKARSVKQGVPVGYPHTTAGAVSAAGHFTDATDVFAPAVAQQQAQVIADPDYTDLIGSYAQQAARNARTGAGLPADGASDTSTYAVAQSRAYQVASAVPDRVVVWFLVTTSSSVHGVASSGTQVDGDVMVWKAGDWKLGVDTLYGLPKTHPKVAIAGSAQAAAQGWMTVEYQK